MEEKSTNNTYTGSEEANLSTGITPEIKDDTNISETLLSSESEQFEEEPEQLESKKEKIKRLTVKALIWLGFLTAHAILTTCLNFAGITLGAIPATVIFVLVLLFAKKCGKMWDKSCYNRRQKRKKSNFNDISIQLNKSDANVSEICLSKEGEQPAQNGRFYGNDMLLEENTENLNNDYSLSKQDENIDYNKVPQSSTEDIAPDQESESSSDLSYREEKIAIRKDYQEKKKELKSQRHPTSIKTFKIATIVLSLVLAIVCVVSMIVIFSYSNQLKASEQKLTSTEAQLKVSRSLQDSYNKKWLEEKENVEELTEYKTFMSEHIAFIDSDENYHYHKFNCPYFKNANSFYIFNIEYAKSNGYVECEKCHGSFSVFYN